MSKTHKLHVVTRGQGRPVILLHGMMSSNRYWTDIAERVGGERQLIMPDLPGFGKSPKPRRAAYDIDLFIKCLEETLQDYDFKEKPVLVGHSMGALIALRWAVERPERFSGLVLSAPVFLEQDKLWQQIASIALEKEKLTGRRRARIVAVGMGFSGLVPTRIATRLSKNWPKHIVEDVTRQKYRVFRKLMKNKFFMEEVLDDLRKVQVMTKIVVGKRDLTSYHAIEHIDVICRDNTHCNVEVLPTGHQIPLETPETVAKVILSV